MKVILYIILFHSYSFSTQLLSQTLPSETDIEFRGAIGTNGGDQTEFFEQRRTLLWGLTLDSSTKVQVGLSKTRVENQEILELPLLFRYQIIEIVSAYGRFQTQLTRDLTRKYLSIFRQMEATFGVDYDISPTWDAGV